MGKIYWRKQKARNVEEYFAVWGRSTETGLKRLKFENYATKPEPLIWPAGRWPWWSTDWRPDRRRRRRPRWKASNRRRWVAREWRRHPWTSPKVNCGFSITDRMHICCQKAHFIVMIPNKFQAQNFIIKAGNQLTLLFLYPALSHLLT